MSRSKKYIVGSLLCIPGILLIAFAIAPLRDGIAVDSALPVPNYMIRQSLLPKVAYGQAATALKGADSANGDAHLLAAEAALDAGAKPSTQIALIQQALARSPANARGWMILSDAYASANPKMAAAALGQSFLFSPYDFWIAEPRAARAARLWSNADDDTRSMAAQQTRLLWEYPDLWQKMRALLTQPQAVALVGTAFKGHQEEVRDLNRWLSVERRRHPWGD